MRFSIVIVVCAAFGPRPLGCTGPTTEALQAEQSPVDHDGRAAQELVREGASLIDVRSPAEFAEGHIGGAQNVPVDEIDARDLGPKDGALVVYCKSGRRSAQAAAALRARGYTRVYDLGAMSNWIQ